MRRFIVIVAALTLSACAVSATGSEACEAAAWAQADAEQRWGQAIEAHELVHASVIEDTSRLDHAEHDATAEAIVAARVEMIVAEAETRHQCD
ncbi:MAG: hypothetical protein F4155_12590 [Acidimicrobiales bacterium]|nr:hypothetical protein [Acidimicrobiales bacterium]MYH75624.1 hypothetical protein [Acidimicrobiales bacterium]MYK72427.1 hypothetical protein [Acidimicrobiales bacterium]